MFMFSFMRDFLVLILLVFTALQVNAQCTGAISYVNYDSLTIADSPMLYCFNDFETNAGAPLTSPINGIFIPFFVNTQAELIDDVYEGSTLSTSAGTIYDIVASGSLNDGQATIYVKFLNLQQTDLQNENITISFEDASGDCQHELIIDVANELPANLENTCESFECEYAFKIEYINWAEFSFINEPIAYCAEELSNLYPESRGTYDGGRTNADKPGVYIPFLVRTNASAFIFDGATLNTSNGAIYSSIEPPAPTDGSAENNIFFLYLTEGNLSNNLININFTDSTGVCIVRKTLNLSDNFPDLDLKSKCIPQNCGNDECDGIEDYANCPDDCPCAGKIEFINWPNFEITEQPNFYCAENLDIDSVNYIGGNTNLADPGVYIPFIIDTEALLNDINNLYEGSVLASNVGQIFNSTSPPTINDDVASASVHFLYVNEADLDRLSLRINFVDAIGGCTHLRTINIEEELPGILPLPECPCRSEIRYINWNNKSFTDKPIAYCAEQIGDFPNWETNVSDPSVFIPFVVESGAVLNADSTAFDGSTLTSTAGTIYNTTSPPSLNSGEARIFIHLLALTKTDLENNDIILNFEEPSTKCSHSSNINVPTDLANVDTEVCLEATCGNDVCEAVEDYLNCPTDCECEGSVQYLAFTEWPTLTLANQPNAYCIESLVPAGIEAATDTLNPGIFIPFTIVTDAPTNEDGFFEDAKLNATFGTIYDITAPPVEHTGNVSTAHYLYLTEEDLQNGNEVQIAFSYSTNICLHNEILNLTEALPDLNIKAQCLNAECGNMVCEAAEDYSTCNSDCPCTGNINFINWDTKRDITEPQAYCFVDLSNADNQIDATNNSVFIPFVVRTSAVLGADSLYSGSQLGASIGTIYNSLDVPVLNAGTGSIFIQFLQLTNEELGNNDNSILFFANENGDCQHEVTLSFSDLEIDLEACKDVGVNDFDTNFNISINPNPVDNYLNIQILNNTQPVQSISIYSINSQLIAFQNLDNALNNIQLNTSTYKAGTYLINITLSDGSVVAKRFVKQ